MMFEFLMYFAGLVSYRLFVRIAYDLEDFVKVLDFRLRVLQFIDAAQIVRRGLSRIQPLSQIEFVILYEHCE